MANTLTSQQVQSFLQPFGYTGNAQDGSAQAFIDANPNVKAQFDAYASGGTGTTPAMPVDMYMSNQIQNPNLPQEFVPALQQVNQNELMTADGKQLDTAANTVNSAQDLQSTQVDAEAITSGFDKEAGQYNAALIGDQTAQAEAQQGQVDRLSTVKGQLENLYAEAQPGEVPAWARGAVTKAEEVLAARGLGSSTIGAVAIAEAIQQSALPIAAQDAATYFQMDLTNLNNRQVTELENTRLRQQSLLTDQAATNAAEQFNASSAQQTEQFMATLVASIKAQNAARSDAMQQFNVSSDIAVDQFNANMRNQREQFNSNMAFAIEQSNTQWRRQINTQNTAAINAANQANVQNAFNLSANALNNLWQQFRDESSWLFQASENELDRQFNLTMAANNRAFQQEAINDANKQKLYEQLGGFAFNLLS